jgi:hypothetical protein
VSLWQLPFHYFALVGVGFGQLSVFAFGTRCSISIELFGAHASAQRYLRNSAIGPLRDGPSKCLFLSRARKQAVWLILQVALQSAIPEFVDSGGLARGPRPLLWRRLKRAGRSQPGPSTLERTNAIWRQGGLGSALAVGRSFREFRSTSMATSIRTRWKSFGRARKRGLHGTYIGVEPYHLFRYLDEQAFRYNERHVTDGYRFLQLCQQRHGTPGYLEAVDW